ncbi:hypothetical protein [Streptomyces thermolilacinus]|uniref:hypothetical protein n=1 Tax=Streptomyces thermolilacinus TaxID=285540 RepID=UPI003411D33F
MTPTCGTARRPPGPDHWAWSRELAAARDRLGALARSRHPDRGERVRHLLAWAGASARDGAGSKWYETAVLHLLLAEGTGPVLDACTPTPLSPAQLDGCAELFATVEWTREQGGELPEPLRTRLVEHIHADGTDAMRFRVRHGYYGAGRAV